MIRYILIGVVMFAVAGCSQKKLVVKNCEKAGNADVYVCDPL